MLKSAHKTIYLRDYRPSDYHIDHVKLCFELEPEATLVHTEISFRRAAPTVTSLRLNGVDLDLVSINVKNYTLEEDALVLHDVPEALCLKTTVRISPASNTALQGLYLSQAIFCTQCEAEAFRRITYFLDRPDVLTTYTVKIIADKAQYPVLLSNGNLIEQGNMSAGKHYAVWHDPHKKPCYLFALVAGDLGHIASTFVTCSGRKVDLKIYAQSNVLDQCEHAMESLKHAMAWDEKVYHREYDLDVFHIVAIHDFVFGAMENKSLNIFNAKYILAKPETATDQNRRDITTVVAHEYFHNWSGNRVTCRDWFQLSLKEGFTIFREQSFDEDRYSFVVHRIRKVQELRDRQFKEDAGPMAHPIQPDHYMTIDNFYTATVYNKGGEVIRMLKTLLGAEVYHNACDEYFSRFDGQAVTCDDFVAVMQAVSGYDLTQFKRWYSQAGTPQVWVTTFKKNKHYHVTLRQSCEPPLVIPVKLALFDHGGKTLVEQLLVLTQAEKTFSFNVENAIPSLLREFSAPIKLHYDYRDDELVFLMRHDSDGFNRWEAAQRLATRIIFGEEALFSSYAQVFGEILQSHFADKSFQAELLTLPSEQALAELMPQIEIEKIIAGRDHLAMHLATQLEQAFLQHYTALNSEQDDGARALKQLCLQYLTRSGKHTALVMQQFSQSLARDMTECLSALSALSHHDTLERVEALARFEDHWREDGLVMNKWLSVQAATRLPQVLETVKNLMHQPFFNVKNPNNVYALIGVFTGNMRAFHAIDGSGYRFIAEIVAQLDTINPSVASRMVEPLLAWRRYDVQRQFLMRQSLERLRDIAKLSDNVFECVSSALS